MKTKNLKNFLAALLLALPVLPACAQQASSRTYSLPGGTELTYQRRSLWQTLAAGPADTGLFVRQSFKKENLPWLGAIAASSLILIKYDQQIYDETRRVGKRLSISGKDKTETMLMVKGVAVFRGPTDLGSALYFIGDGWVTLGFIGSLEGYGWLGDDMRARQTGHQLTEGLLATGVVTQVLKRSFGRETPNASNKPGGRWRLFPSFAHFKQYRRGYDAFPSGHLATCMMTTTVLAENYPEKSYIRPVGYTLMGLLSFQMINNGVHWAGDYPLGLAIGYGLGQAIARDGRTAARRVEAAKPSPVALLPYFTPDGGAGARLAYGF